MKNILIIGLTMFGALCWGLHAHAALIDQDWQAPDDSKIIYDTDTNLRWLDLRVTASMSHDTVVANLEAGGIFEGFELATQTEVLDLWGNAGITNTERVWVTDQYAPVEDLVNRLGATLMVESGGMFTFATHTIGMAEGGPALPPDQRWAMELTYAPDGLNTRTSTSFYTWDVSIADAHYSTYLVQSVPLPAAVWLFGSGLIALLGIARCKQK